MHTQFFRAVMQALDGATSTDVAAATLYDLMEDDERLAMLQGDWSLSRYLSQRHLTDDTSVPYPASALPRIGVPGFHFVDGPRGSMVGCSTEFPSPSNRAASFDCLQEQLIVCPHINKQGSRLVANRLYRDRQSAQKFVHKEAIFTVASVSTSHDTQPGEALQSLMAKTRLLSAIWALQ